MTCRPSPAITVAWLLCVFAAATSAQTESSARIPAQSNAPLPTIRVESGLVMVRVQVLDKKVWKNGPTKEGRRCVQADAETLATLPGTEPYLPPDCDGLYVRGLTAKDFHLFVDGVEQKIRGVTTGNEGIRIRDNRGIHIELSEAPAAKWSGADYYRESDDDWALKAADRYDLSFTPDKIDAGSCRKIKVSVDRRDSIVKSRSEYCVGESPSNTLSGTELGKQLELDLASRQVRQDIAVSLQTGIFSTATHKGRVRIALDFAGESLHREWGIDWTLHGTIGTLGMVYGWGGALVARFSDLACCAPYLTPGFVFGQKGANLDQALHLGSEVGLPFNPISMLLNTVESAVLPTRYETQLELPPGEYDLRMALSDGQKFGRAETHLTIDKYDGRDLGLSSVMLCKRFRDAHVAAVESATADFAPQYVPMVSKGIQVTPAGDTDFKTGEPLIPYFEIYAPQIGVEPAPAIQAHLRILDAKTGETVKDFPAVDAAPYAQPGSTTIPVAREVPIAALPKGSYRLEVQASDSGGRSTPWRTANFTITGKN